MYTTLIERKKIWSRTITKTLTKKAFCTSRSVWGNSSISNSYTVRFCLWGAFALGPQLLKEMNCISLFTVKKIMLMTPEVWHCLRPETPERLLSWIFFSFCVLHDERGNSTWLSLTQTYVLSHVTDWGSEEEEGATQGRDITNEEVEVEQTSERV